VVMAAVSSAVTSRRGSGEDGREGIVIAAPVGLVRRRPLSGPVVALARLAARSTGQHQHGRAPGHVGRQVLETTGGDLTVEEVSIADVSVVEVSGRVGCRSHWSGPVAAQLRRGRLRGGRPPGSARQVVPGGDGQQHIGAERGVLILGGHLGLGPLRDDGRGASSAAVLNASTASRPDRVAAGLRFRCAGLERDRT
jgi:hypothetical protein